MSHTARIKWLLTEVPHRHLASIRYYSLSQPPLPWDWYTVSCTQYCVLFSHPQNTRTHTHTLSLSLSKFYLMTSTNTSQTNSIYTMTATTSTFQHSLLGSGSLMKPELEHKTDLYHSQGVYCTDDCAIRYEVWLSIQVLGQQQCP